jgi:hypothetical protein
MTFTFHYDAGHGWLEVSKDVLPTVGWEIKHGDIKVKQRDNGNSSPIRNLAKVEPRHTEDWVVI